MSAPGWGPNQMGQAGPMGYGMPPVPQTPRRRGAGTTKVGVVLLLLAVVLAVTGMVLLQGQLNAVQDDAVDLSGSGRATATVELQAGEKRTIYRHERSAGLECRAEGADVEDETSSTYTSRGESVEAVATVTARRQGPVTITCRADGGSARAFVGQHFDDAAFAAKVFCTIGGILLGFVGVGVLVVGLVLWGTTKPPRTMGPPMPHPGQRGWGS